MEISQHIEINPKIMMGKPVIKGTRITVESLLEKLSSGEKEEDILHSHPHITRKYQSSSWLCRPIFKG